MRETRWTKIRDRDLTDWRVWWDAGKYRYPEKKGSRAAGNLWMTLDSRMVAWSFRWPAPIGTLIRVLVAVVLSSNRYEPFPIGNDPGVNNLWAGKPDWYRWLRWRLFRNPWPDLRKFYMGFAYAIALKAYTLDVSTEARENYLMLYAPRFAGIPWHWPVFPYLHSRSRDRQGLFVALGWKDRGIPGGNLQIEGD